MPKPVTDSAKGTSPKTTSTVPACWFEALCRSQPEILSMAPVSEVMRESSTPPKRINSTSRMVGPNMAPARMSSASGVGKKMTAARMPVSNE